MLDSILNKLNNKYTHLFLVILVLFFSLNIRVSLWNGEGGDQKTYKQAVLEFNEGINPYIYTVKSFADSTLNLKHGYAYLPSLLYVQYFFFWINTTFDLDLALRHLWKIPVLLADLGVGFLLYRYLKDKDRWIMLLSIAIWFLNPYILARGEYNLYDPIPIFFLLWALINLGKNDTKVGLLYGLAISFKTFSVILFPLFFLLSRSKWKFLFGGFIIAFLISIPFMRGLNEFIIYLQGSIFVHSARGIQGRPFITFLEYYLFGSTDRLLQQDFNIIFTYSSLFIPWIFVIYAKLKNLNLSKYMLAAISFCIYYILTPVLSRTHILWGLPFILIASYEYIGKRWNTKYFYILWTFIFVLLYSYLRIWNKGFNMYELISGGYIVIF